MGRGHRARKKKCKSQQPESNQRPIDFVYIPLQSIALPTEKVSNSHASTDAWKPGIAETVTLLGMQKKTRDQRRKKKLVSEARQPSKMRRILAKTALLAVLAAGKDPPIPPWMRAILDSRPNFRGSVHRSQYPEDLELKAAGALLAKPPIRNPVVVAMTTTPTRVAACEPAVRSLLNQSQPALIIVSIPDARGGVLLHKLWHLFAIASTALR